MKVNKDKIEISIGEGIEFTTQQFLIELRKTVTSMTNAGMSIEEIKKVLNKHSEEGTGPFGVFKKGLKSVVSSNVSEAANQAAYAEFQSAGVKKYRWITVSEHPCPDCAERHGQIESWEDWELMGLPKSGFSVCQENCKCRLVPVDYTGKGLDQPIIRQAKSPKGQAYASYREIKVTDYISNAKDTLVVEDVAKQKARKHPDFAGEMTYSERVDWVRQKPDAVYFRLHKGKKQVAFVRGDYYVFSEDGEFKTAFIPDQENIEIYRNDRRYKWIRIPEGKWKKMIK